MDKNKLINQLKEMLHLAKDNNIYIRGSIQCCFGYRNPKDVSINDVLKFSDIFLDFDIDEIVYADTSANANPRLISQFFEYILKYIPLSKISMHYHSKMNLGLVNMFYSFQYGIYRYDTSFGYLGGCPFLEDSKKNISTEEAINLCNSLGLYLDIDLDILKECNEILNKSL